MSEPGTAPPDSVRVRVRRRVALGLLIAAPVIAAVTVLAFVDGGEMVLPSQHVGHVYLRPLAHPVLGLFAAAAMLAIGARLRVRRRMPRFITYLAAVFVAAPAVYPGLMYAWLIDGFALSKASVVAASADLKVVSYRSPGFFSSDRTVLRVRSREGLVSRESTQDLACFAVPSSGAGPEWQFDHASFVGADDIEIVAKDGYRWRTHVDPRNLSFVGTVDRCLGAPDYLDD